MTSTSADMDVYRRNLKLLKIFSFLRFAAFWQPVEQLFVYSIQGDEFVLAVGFAMWSLAQFVLEIPSGYFADVFGRKASFLVGQVARILGYLFIVIPLGIPYYYVGLFLFGVAYSFTSGSDNALLHETLEKLGEIEKYKRYSGRLKSLNVTGVLAGAVLAIPISLISYRLNYALSILPQLASLVVVYMIHEPKIDKSKIRENAFISTKKVFRLVSKQHVLLFWVVLVALMEFVKRVGMDFGQAFIFDLSDIAVLASIAWAGGAFTRLIGNELAHRYSKGLAPLVLGSVAQFIAMSYSPTYLAVAFFLAMFIPINMAIILNEEVIQKIAPPSLRATTLSSINFVNQIVVGIPMLLLGAAITQHDAIISFRYVGYAVAGAVAIVLISLSLYRNGSKTAL